MKEVINNTVLFDENDSIYKVHFPDCPVVPGSIIIDMFLKVVISSRSDCRYEVGNFNFMKFVMPGLYSFSIEFESGAARCRLYRDSELLSKGVIEYEAVI